jgi:cobalt-precorrin-5B (C1)-methyltransferase
MMESMRLVNGNFLRRGYSTGTCAAAAAGAAAWMLLRQTKRETYNLITPKGVSLTLNMEDAQFAIDRASCAVRKDFSDDPDVTKGVAVYAAVSLCGEGVHIKGGEGVGRVTKNGLDQGVGEAAINSTPRRMIASECAAVAKETGYTGGFMIIISVPGGEELALKTFNPKVGVLGGISILGTSGIVEPMSEAAYTETMRLELRQLYAEGSRELVVVVGNFAKYFAEDTLKLHLNSFIKCSNFAGLAFTAAAEIGFKRALLIGHIGKLVKLGIGMTNTHSSHGDGRIETFIACALEAGAPLSLLRGIAKSVTTDAVLDLLREANMLKETMGVLQQRMEDTLWRHSTIESGFICFGKTSSAPVSDNKCGEIVAQSTNAQFLRSCFINE